MRIVDDAFTRWQLARSTHRLVDGLWIGATDDEVRLLDRMEMAVLLIASADPRRHQRVRRFAGRLWVRLQAGSSASFNRRWRLCEFDPRFVGAPETSIADIAAAIVHECTHAQLEHYGITYREHRRHRIEAICHRQEVAFARRISGGEAVCARAQAWLTADPTYWNTADMETRRLQGLEENLRHLGFPAWAMPALRRFAAASRATLRFARGLTTRWSRRTRTCRWRPLRGRILLERSQLNLDR